MADKQEQQAGLSDEDMDRAREDQRHREVAYRNGVIHAAEVARSYNCTSTHPNDLGDCILSKLNQTNKVARKNDRALPNLRPDLTAALAREAGFEKAIDDALLALDAANELNMSNYDHDDVADLNAASVNAYLILTEALATPGPATDCNCDDSYKHPCHSICPTCGGKVPMRYANATDGQGAATEATPNTGGVRAIAAERQRQITPEGWTSDHDDMHTGCELAAEIDRLDRAATEAALEPSGIELMKVRRVDGQPCEPGTLEFRDNNGDTWRVPCDYSHNLNLVVVTSQFENQDFGTRPDMALESDFDEICVAFLDKEAEAAKGGA